MSNTEEKIKVGLVSLGCPKNQVDSELILGSLVQEGYSLTPKAEEAEVIIVNTCGFIDQAKEESVDTLISMGELKKEGRCKLLIATGCLTQRYPGDMLDQMPEIDAVLGTGDFPKIASLCRTLFNKKTDIRPRFTDTTSYLQSQEMPRLRLGPKHSAYVKIAEGCNYRCAFCAIPSFRGDLKSRPIDAIVDEVRRLAEEGVVEINLIAQSLTSFGIDRVIEGRNQKEELNLLLKALTRIDRIQWIRLFYTYPTDFSDNLIDLIAGEEKICSYIDLPLQHIDNTLLRKMNRKGKRDRIETLIAKIRRRIPDATLRSTFIVGFPGETDQAYETLYRFIEETGFDRLGIFTYSPEEGTPAYPLGDPIPEDLKVARQEALIEMQRQISRQKNRKMIGTLKTVLVEGLSKETDLLLEGRWQGQAPDIDGVVLINDSGSRKLNPGEFVSVRIEAAHDYDLVGGVEEALLVLP
ncbi:MAG: 30S ribosomal protein S12 methylthiotransferase RimO [Nitrospiria bacterium]